MHEIAKAETDDCTPNFIDISSLLNVLVGLEDQLYQIITQSDSLSVEALQAFTSHDTSRAHTALGRLTSLISMPSHTQISPVSLAEHGICNIMDKSFSEGMRFYQHMQVDLENIYYAHPDGG
jgi:hypothetical protein